MHEALDILCRLYRGFYIDRPVGNNAFSYNQRRQKRIYVPPLIRGRWRDLRQGDEVVFSEIVDGKETNCRGLDRLICWQRTERQRVFFMDNHNHALMFWFWAVRDGWVPAGLPLVHVDQHKDTRRPSEGFPPAGLATEMRAVFDYVNFTLDVGNFIPPAVEAGVVGHAVMVTSEQALTGPFPGRYVLDLDLDFFAAPMAYIDNEKKYATIKNLIAGADLITVATSPFFMDYALAARWIKRLFTEPGDNDGEILHRVK